MCPHLEGSTHIAEEHSDLVLPQIFLQVARGFPDFPSVTPHLPMLLLARSPPNSAFLVVWPKAKLKKETKGVALFKKCSDGGMNFQSLFWVWICVIDSREDTGNNTSEMRDWWGHVIVEERAGQTCGMGLWAGAFMDKLNFSPE